MSKTPKLRFKEFSGDWEEKRFDTIFLDIKNKTSDIVNYPLYSLTIESGVVPKSERYERDFLVTKDEENFKIVNKDEFVYNPMNLRFGALARYKGTIPVSVSGYYNVFKVIDGSPCAFWDNYLKTNRMMYLYNTIATGSLIEKRRVHFSQFIELNLPVPSIKEQEKIASFFSLIDDKISLQGEKVEALKDYKKGIMQKIFSRELRFKDDNGKDYPEWEEKKLGDFTKLMQSGLSRKLSDKDIGIPVIRSNNLIDGKIDISDIKYWHSIDDQGAKLENYFLKKNDLLVNFINSLAQIGKCSIYTDELKRNTIFTTNIMRLNFEHDIDVNYIFNYFQLKKYNDYIQSITKPAVNQASFTTADFKRFKVDLPNIEEQIKIGKLFKMLDSKIAKEQEKLDSLNEYKKGLLQQMFV